MLVHHFVEYYARNFPSNPCITEGDRTTTYGELDALANRLANGLLSLGVGKVNFPVKLTESIDDNLAAHAVGH